MSRLDAHAHFFYPGFAERLPNSTRRLLPDEITLYHALADQHEIDAVLAIGYEGQPWALGNNAYIAHLAEQHAWVRPLAFVREPATLTVAQLQDWQQQRFVGITFYCFTPAEVAALARVDAAVWQWLADHAWLISVNSNGEAWNVWQRILSNHPALTLLIAHLGLPPALREAPQRAEAEITLQPVLQLARFANVHVKFSGFYALAEPSHAYPHAASWPYAQAITDAFGASRILWASDFSPALEHVSFPQTVDLLEKLSWLTPDDLNAIYHDNLARLLTQFAERNPTP
jgi:predicted TIM-barrel fold metal-dependent hydrolase